MTFVSHARQADTCRLCIFTVAVAGVAVGSGWQALVAYVNVGSYYLIGVPLGILLGWPLHFGVGVMLQTLNS